MKQVEITIRNASGLHARPAARFVRAATAFQSSIRIENLSRQTKAVDAKSILMVLTIGASAGSRLRLTIEGPDETNAEEDLTALILGGLGEETIGDGGG